MCIRGADCYYLLFPIVLEDIGPYLTYDQMLDQVYMLAADTELNVATMRSVLGSGHSRVPVHRPGNRCAAHCPTSPDKLSPSPKWAICLGRIVLSCEQDDVLSRGLTGKCSCQASTVVGCGFAPALHHIL